MIKEKIKKILIVKFCCFGDAVFLTPVIDSLKNNFPEAKLSFLHGPWIRPLIKYIDGIEENIEFDLKQDKNLIIKSIRAMKLVLLLRKKKFDLVFLGHRNSVFGIVLFLSSIKYRFGFKNTKFINYSSSFGENIREVNRYLKVLEDNGIKTYSDKTRLVPREKSEVINEFNKYGKDSTIIGIFPFGGINPGTDMEIKRWNIDNYKKLIEKTSDTYKDCRIIIFEGTYKSEKMPLHNFATNVSVEDINLDLISICKIFVSGDTGPLHIASAFGVNTVSLFGPSDPRLVAPVTKDKDDSENVYIWKKPECSPCYTPETSIDMSNSKYWKGNKFICYTGEHTCIKSITVDEVYFAISQIINKIK
ncbi:MAG: glycosyltransferase family 9 protein [Ignavibacteriae bacterium]|nr:glycosyltransferase family 9 protein [Ignavibacteriota bacterium]